jgi:hypothetical protein
MGLALAEDRLRKEKPDIVFIEYAINNGIDKLHMAAFESLINKLLHFESKPAVIPIIVCNVEFYTCSSYMELTAKHYALPAVNIYHVIKTGLEKGIFEWSEYSCDYGHPSVNGHRLIADCIMELMEQFRERESTPYRIPRKACFGRDFTDLIYFGRKSLPVEENGSFEPSVTIMEFPDGWRYQKNKSNTPMRFSVTCKSLFILYEINNSMDYGEIEVLKEGKVICRIDGYSIYGWGNPDIRLVFQEAESKLLQFEIRMRPGDENKKFFLLGFGVVRS